VWPNVEKVLILVGAAFDVSLRSYYELDESGGWKSVAVWNINDRDNFKQTAIEALVDVLELDEKQGLCKLTIEPFVGEDESVVPSVAHVCVNSRLTELGYNFSNE